MVPHSVCGQRHPSTKTKQRQHKKEKHQAMFVNTGAKDINKISANQIHEYTKSYYKASVTKAA
jgi:hypothetical protein